MTRALVLDFGGVVTRTLFETHAITEAALGLAPGTLKWRGPFDAQSDPLWQELEDGRITERDYWLLRTREVGALLGEDWERMETFVVRARGADPDAVIRPEAVAAIGAAKAAGCRIAILSNDLDLFYGRELRRRVAVLRHADFIVDATYTGILKPDPRAYALCVERLGVPAAACVFVDDQRRNVEGAIEAGMRAVQFDIARPTESFRRALDLLGVSP